MSSNSAQKPSPMVPFFLGLAPLGFGVHLFSPEAADPPQLILSGVLISLGVILLARAVRNVFYKPDELTVQVQQRRASVPFIERRKSRSDRREQSNRRWLRERRQSLGGVERRQGTNDRRSQQDRRVSRNRQQRWDDPSVLHPVKPNSF